MDELDKKIIDELQRDFPVAAEPYKIVAERLGIGADDMFDRVKKLVKNGTIRRVGVSVDSRKLGFASTLAAIRVTEKEIDKACSIIDSMPEITHSYLRKDQYNIWFTIIAPDIDRLNFVLETIRTGLNLGQSDVLNLPVKKMFKLDARFKTNNDKI